MIQVGQREIASLENQIDELNSAKEETEAELIAVHKQLESQQDVLKTFSDVSFGSCYLVIHCFIYATR